MSNTTKHHPELRAVVAAELRHLKLMRWKLQRVRQHKVPPSVMVATPSGLFSHGFLKIVFETQFASQIARVCAARKVLFAASENPAGAKMCADSALDVRPGTALDDIA
jgi:hypothetical protein